MLESMLGNHSADVEMWLDCGAHGKIPLRRITPSSVVLKESRTVPPCDATLVVVVDGKRMTRRVNLTKGISENRAMARILPVNEVAPF
jgi:hypothetical protein